MGLGKMIPFGLACLCFCIGTFVSWYEGSYLVENPQEWKHSAVITSKLHDGEVERGNISQLDYFIYAIKFKPIFPSLMLASFVYIALALFQRLLKGSKKLPLSITVLGLLLIGGSALLSASPTEGAKTVTVVLLVLGVATITYAFNSYYRIVWNRA